MNERINPPTLLTTHTHAYCQVVTSTGSKSIHISGQVACNAQGEVVAEGDLRGQTMQALQNVKLALEAGGGSLKDLVRMNYYVVDYKPEDAAVVIKAVEDFLGDMPGPAGSLIGVSALLVPEFMIEIDAEARL